MNLYVDFSKRVYEQKKKLKEALGSTPYEDAVKIFQNKDKGIASELRTAEKCWRLVLPDETMRFRLENWIDKQFDQNLLGEFEVKMKDVNNYRKIGTLLDEKEQKEIDTLLATPVADWEKSAVGKDLNYEQQAIESLKEGMK
jgi:hypothetical protein